MKTTKILWIAVPAAFLVAVLLTLLGPAPEAKPEVKLRQIVTLADKEDAEDIERARLKIEDIHERLEQGENFASLATELSEALNSTQGGDMGWMGEGILPANLEDVAFELDGGQHSEILEEVRNEKNVLFRILFVEERRNF